MNNTVLCVVLFSIVLQQFGVIGAPYTPRGLTFQLTAKVAYYLNSLQFFNSKMQRIDLDPNEVHWYFSKQFSAEHIDYRSVFITNKLQKPIQVSCSTSKKVQIGTLTLKPGFSYFFRFEDNYWNSETYSCVASYTTKKLSFDAYKGKAPIAYQNGFEIREDGIYLINGTSRILYKGKPIMFLGIGSKLTNGFAVQGNKDYRVIQFENRRNYDVLLRCDANHGNGNTFTIGGRVYTVPKRKVYKLAIEAGNFETGFVECFVGAVNRRGLRVYGENSYGQYQRGSEYYFINQNNTITFKTIVNVKVVESEIANTDPEKHLIQIENQMTKKINVHCWGKHNKNSPQINVGLKDYLLKIGEIYTFSIPVDSFINGEFWCDICGTYPESRYIKIYGYEKFPRSNHFYAIRYNRIYYEKVNNEFIFHF